MEHETQTVHDCHVERADRRRSRAALKQASPLRLSILGMGCRSCANRIHNALLECAGVLAVDASFESGTALVLYDRGVIAPAGILDTIDRAGRESGHSYRAIPLDAASVR